MPAETAMFTTSGRLQWQSEEFGGVVWFCENGPFLVTDTMWYEWRIVTDAGEVEREGMGHVATSSRDCQYLASEGGRLETVEGVLLLQGSSWWLEGTNWSNLWVMSDLSGDQFLGYRPTGELLWRIPDRSGNFGVTEDGTVVYVVRHSDGLPACDGTSGDLLLRVPEVKRAAASADGQFMAALSEKVLALYGPD